jgi:hypothetical protein
MCHKDQATFPVILDYMQAKLLGVRQKGKMETDKKNLTFLM